MFRCSEVAERASLLVDGDLGPWQRFNMKLHLAMCRGCRAFIAQIRITRDLTHMTGVAEGQHISPQIEAALAQRRSRSIGKS